jgi:hypothetical protein
MAIHGVRLKERRRRRRRLIVRNALGDRFPAHGLVVPLLFCMYDVS